MVHTLSLDNYTPTPRKLVLGTNSSYGIESIKIERGAGWDGLNLTATWHIPGREEPLRVALLDEADIAEVEALAQAYYDALDAESTEDVTGSSADGEGEAADPQEKEETAEDDVTGDSE